MRALLIFTILVSPLFANPWASGRGNRYFSLSYSTANYDRIYLNDKQFHFSNQEVTNESWDMGYYYGMNDRDTLILTSKYSNIGAFAPIPGPGTSQWTDTYLGMKRTYRSGKISQAWELGYMSPTNYDAKTITAPGYGESEIVAAWHWGKVNNMSNFISFSARYRKRDNAAPNAAQLSFEYIKKIKEKLTGRVIAFYDEQFSAVNLFDAMTGWTNFSFHRKDESQLIGALAFAYKLKPGLDANFQIAHKFDGRNTDASDRSITVGLGWSF